MLPVAIADVRRQLSILDTDGSSSDGGIGGGGSSGGVVALLTTKRRFNGDVQ
jgi:hypothetical protein